MPQSATPTTPCPVRVLVCEDNGVAIHDKTGDHNERFFRDWITKTTWWAMRNGKTVHMSSAA